MGSRLVKHWGNQWLLRKNYFKRLLVKLVVLA